jgi:hypothetical protein
MTEEVQISGPHWGVDQTIDRDGIRYRVADAVWVPQGDLKMIVLQRIEHELPTRRLEFRFAYYAREAPGENLTGARRWKFGQSALFIPPIELGQVLALASRKWTEFAAAVAFTTRGE